jgi:hypothetical protein
MDPRTGKKFAKRKKTQKKARAKPSTRERSGNEMTERNQPMDFTERCPRATFFDLEEGPAIVYVNGLEQYRGIEEVLREAIGKAGLHSRRVRGTGLGRKRLDDFYHNREPLLPLEMNILAKALGLTWKLVPLHKKVTT